MVDSPLQDTKSLRYPYTNSNIVSTKNQQKANIHP